MSLGRKPQVQREARECCLQLRRGGDGDGGESESRQGADQRPHGLGRRVRD